MIVLTFGNTIITDLIKLVTSLKTRKILFFAVLFVVLNIFNCMCKSGIDRSDYKKVAENFINENPVIAKNIGKVQKVSHIGPGGGAGSVSYNVYNVIGENKSGVCNIELRKKEDKLWYVSSAMLTVEGAQLKLPVKMDRKGKPIKIFK